MDRVDYESLIISDLLGFYNTKSLDINPWYQRRSVWSPPQKAYLMNTIFEKKPVPSIYIRQQIDIEKEKSLKEVVDGQQRVRTIISARSRRGSRLRLISVTCGRPTQGGMNSGRKVTIARSGRRDARSTIRSNSSSVVGSAQCASSTTSKTG
jgi:hypothetical protein